MRKPSISITLTEESMDVLDRLADLFNTNKSQSVEILLQFVDKNYLDAAVAVFKGNGHEMKDGRYKDGIRQD